MPRCTTPLKFSCLWIAYFVFMPYTYGQATKLDSLRRQLKISKRDTFQIQLYYAYGEELANSLPDSALWYYGLAKERAQALKFKKGSAAYASHAIEILNAQGRYRDALELCQEALKLYKVIGNQHDIATALINVGSEWHYLSDFQLATDFYLRALKIAEAIFDKRLQRIINNNLASIFINLKAYGKGKDYAEKSLALAKELNDAYAISSSTFNIATAELSLKEYENALKHYSEITRIGQNTNDYIVLLDGWLGTADVYNAQINEPQALKYYHKVFDLSKAKEAPEYEMYAHMGLADLLMKSRQYEKSEHHILLGIDLAQRLGSNYELKDLYQKASELAEVTGRFSEALRLRKHYEILNDSIVGEKSKSNINLLEAKFESEKKESIISNLEYNRKIQALSIKQKKMLNYLLIGVIITILLLSFLSYRGYRHKQKLQALKINELETEKQLAATEAVLKGEEQERTRLAKDLHDGLGGMLSGIKYSFQNMKGTMVMTHENQQVFERSIDMLDSSIKEMRRVAHNMMPESLLKFGLDTALKDFCNHISKSGAVKINYLSFGMEQAAIDQTVAITIYRIIQELINNILKHAAAENSIVQVTKSGAQLVVTVEDDGRGFDTQILNTSNGIGWTNLRHRIDFLKGSFSVDSENGKGTSVHIEITV